MTNPSTEPPKALLKPTPAEGTKPLASLVHDARNQLCIVMSNLEGCRGSLREGYLLAIELICQSVDEETRKLAQDIEKGLSFQLAAKELFQLSHRFDITVPFFEQISTPELEEVKCEVIDAINSYRSLLSQAQQLSESGFPEDEPLTGDLSPVVQSIANGFRNRYPHVHFDIFINDNCQAAFSSMGIRRALDNLIRNAVQALPEQGGRVSVQLRIVDYKDERPFEEIGPGSYVMISVQDDGMGFPADVLSSLKEAPLTTKEGGFGLGLFGARNTIVEKHKGHIIVESREGKGSKVTALIPSRPPSPGCNPPRKSNE